MTNIARHRIRVRVLRGEGFRKRDADLHRPRRPHRIAIREDRLSERHAADEVLVQLAQLLLGLHGIEAFAVGLAVR
jgi:hypothetical protein